MATPDQFNRAYKCDMIPQELMTARTRPRQGLEFKYPSMRPNANGRIYPKIEWHHIKISAEAAKRVADEYRRLLDSDVEGMFALTSKPVLCSVPKKISVPIPLGG